MAFISGDKLHDTQHAVLGFLSVCPFTSPKVSKRCSDSAVLCVTGPLPTRVFVSLPRGEGRRRKGSEEKEGRRAYITEDYYVLNT